MNTSYHIVMMVCRPALAVSVCRLSVILWRPVMNRFHLPALAALLAALSGCTQLDNRHVMHISVADQKMLVTDKGQPVAVYPISTSKFGLSSAPGSYGTPLGRHRVAKMIGDGRPPGAVFKSRKFTGEVLPVDAPGRDPT